MPKVTQFSIVLILLANLFGLISCSNDNNTAYSPVAPAPAASLVSGPIKVELSIPYAPALDQAIDVTCTISSIYDITDLMLTISSWRRLFSQEGSDTVWPSYAAGDNITQMFNLKANEPLSFSAPIAFQETGFWRINASATGYATVHDRYWSDDTDIYLTINSDNGAIGWPLFGPSEYQQLENGEWVLVPPTSENTTRVDVQNQPPPPAIKLDSTGTPIENP